MSCVEGGTGGRLVVLCSEPIPHENVFVDLLASSLPSDIEMVGWSWTRAIFGKYSIIHLHWPESLFRSRRPQLAWVKNLMFVVLMIRIRILNTPLVWTVHNSAPHERLSWLHSAFYRYLTGLVRERVYLFADSDLLSETVIPHGHYRQRYDVFPGAPNSPPEILFFGNLRPYKGIENLIEVFPDQAEWGGARLQIFGQASDLRYARRLEDMVEAKANVEISVGYVDHRRIPAMFASCTIVVLPYNHLYNSGVLMLALSLNRPVLVRESPGSLAVKRDVGDGWVQTFEGELSWGGLKRAISVAQNLDLEEGPDLSKYDWYTIGTQYARVYEGATRGLGGGQ